MGFYLSAAKKKFAAIKAAEKKAATEDAVLRPLVKTCLDAGYYTNRAVMRRVLATLEKKRQKGIL